MNESDEKEVVFKRMFPLYSFEELTAIELRRTVKEKKKKAPAKSWMQLTFQRRECTKFITNPKDECRCCCGRSPTDHNQVYEVLLSPESVTTNERWLPSKHTKPYPTDAYGTLEFQGGPHPTKAQYVRVAYDTRPELLLQLFIREWNLELPKLLITIQGGKANFELQPKLKKVLRKGLLKAAKTTEAWIFTGGTNTGVTRQVGDALLMERSQRCGRIQSVGIAPWGIVENNQELIGHNTEVPYHSISSPRSKLAALNSHHAYFLLVDNGTHGKYGAEIILRRKLERFIATQVFYPFAYSGTPIVCLVIEGGTNTIRAVLEYVTDNPPVPVVVCDGSGRAADLIAFVHKYVTDSGEQSVLDSMKDYLITMIQRTFEVGAEQAECLYYELLQCTRKKHLITVFRISERADAKMQELDQTILTALFKSQHLTPSEQLSLALTWNRVDIARSEIFVYGQEWPNGALEDAMMRALENDRLDFVKLLLENGVSMKKFLTMPRLEDLYNTKQGPSNTLEYILRDLKPHVEKGYVYTLHDIGLVINKLMGGAYRAMYTRRKFRPLYAKVMKKSALNHRNSSAFIKNCSNAMTLITEAFHNDDQEQDLSRFVFPFNELFIWAVLMKRQKMALLMWQHGEEALAKALVACKLYKAMAHEAAEDDMETEVYEELKSYGKEFENISLELLDYCYRQDDDQAQQLLTCELQNWSGQTCLSLAVAANHRALLAHPCSQIILADLWMGGLRTRKNTNLKVILGLILPPYILTLEYKSKEELQLMPQTEEEHLELEMDEDDVDSEKNPDHDVNEKKRSSIHINLKDNKSSINKTKSVKALLDRNNGPKETIVEENGKVLAGMEEAHYHHFSLEERKVRSRPLKYKKRIYEFFTAPITKFWANSIAYVLFLIIFSYAILVKMEVSPNWQEYLAISFILTLGCEKAREFISSEPDTVWNKFAVWTWNMWNPCDTIAILFFLIGLILRLRIVTMDIGRVMYCVDSIYWYLRILNILGVNKYLGPLVTMMGKMVKNMIYFVVLLLVVLMSFGVCRQAILYPNREPDWMIARDVFFEPYFMLYGEVFADRIDPPCSNTDDSDDPKCMTGRWINPSVMAIYLLVANILLINLLIAVFNNIFIEVNAISHQVWMFQRFTVVMEYEQKPILPPPMILLCHLYLIYKYLRRKINGKQSTYDNGLKLFLDKQDMERLYDYEEDCVEGYFSEQEIKLQQSTDDRIRVTTERCENIVQKIDDINTKENNQVTTIQNVEFRLRKIEETTKDILDHLDSLRRFMATRSDLIVLPIQPQLQQQQQQTIQTETYQTQASSDRRLRKTSERSSSDIQSDDSSSQHVVDLIQTTTSATPRKRRKPKPPVRSLSEEVRRPDVYILEDDNERDVEVRTVKELDEDHDVVKACDITVVATNVVTERQQIIESILSVTSEEDNSDDRISPNDLPALDIETLKTRYARRRDSITLAGRRNSESGGNGDIDSLLGSRRSLSRRQLSQTQSEPDNDNGSRSSMTRSQTLAIERNVTFAEPKINVIPPPSSSSSTTTPPPPATTQNSTSSTQQHHPQQSHSHQQNPRSLLIAMHAEYTSITDELENVCGLFNTSSTSRLLSPPRPGGVRRRQQQQQQQPNNHREVYVSRRRNASEMSNPEIALFIEKEHLKDAEESDYMLMENLIQSRYDDDDDEAITMTAKVTATEHNPLLLSVVNESREYRNYRPLRRSSAIEDDMIIPTINHADSQESTTTRQDSGDSSDLTPLVIVPPLQQRPTIVIDSSQLPLHREHNLKVRKADSKGSLHMQSETMC